MPGGEHEAVAVHPAGTLRVVRQGMAKQHRTNLRRPERQTEMPGGTGVHRIDCESTRLIGGLAEEMSLKRHDEKTGNPYRPCRLGKA
jgi:hypothetical protein